MAKQKAVPAGKQRVIAETGIYRKSNGKYLRARVVWASVYLDSGPPPIDVQQEIDLPRASAW